MIKEIIIKIRIYDKKKLYYDIYEKNYLRFNFNQFLRHMHAWMLSEFKLARLFVIRSPPPEKILSAGTLVPIIIKKKKFINKSYFNYYIRENQ